MIKNDEEFYSLLTRRNSGKVTYGFELRSNIEKEDIMEVFLKLMGHNPEKIRVTGDQ
jgi:ribosomal protein S24E